MLDTMNDDQPLILPGFSFIVELKCTGKRHFSIENHRKRGENQTSINNKLESGRIRLCAGLGSALCGYIDILTLSEMNL